MLILLKLITIKTSDTLTLNKYLFFYKYTLPYWGDNRIILVEIQMNLVISKFTEPLQNFELSEIWLKGVSD